MKTAVVIAPGRGTYNAGELGTLKRNRVDLADYDRHRAARGQVALSVLDGADTFDPKVHTRGDTASSLIYAASLADAQALRDVDVVAVIGNSMGWYSALAIAGAVTPMAGFEIVNTMGTLMHESLIGGQVLYPFVDDNWVEIPGQRDALLQLAAQINGSEERILCVSIYLGGMIVFAGNAAGLAAFEAAVEPKAGIYPMRLPNHAAFHTHLQQPVAALGQSALGLELFGGSTVPLVDGRGAIWWPDATDQSDLRDYTLGHQVVAPYDFSRAIAIAAQEFAPDMFIVTGPGTTLGGAVAQSLIAIGWQGLSNKADFQSLQDADPILISMGRDAQRKMVI